MVWFILRERDHIVYILSQSVAHKVLVNLQVLLGQRELELDRVAGPENNDTSVSFDLRLKELVHGIVDVPGLAYIALFHNIRHGCRENPTVKDLVGAECLHFFRPVVGRAKPDFLQERLEDA